MRQYVINGKLVKLYDSIDELPVVNFQKYNKCVLIDAGLGSDIESVDAKIINVAKMISKGEKEKAMDELQNMRQAMHLIVSEVSPKYLAFAALVHSVDGVKNTDLSDDGLKELLGKINEAPASMIEGFLNFVKKNFVPSWKRTTRRCS